MPNIGVPNVFIHGSKLYKKFQTDASLAPVYQRYLIWKNASLSITGRTSSDINNLVDHLNEYKNFAEPIFDRRDNSAQEVLQPSILEEFFEYLFSGLETTLEQTCSVREPERGFIDLVFNPINFANLASLPKFTIRKKDHDFIIGGRFKLSISNSENPALQEENEIVVPAVAIECKRYLERNMLDECSGTAEKVKNATPYCLYLIASEFLKMDEGYPELSQIDEIYILRRQKNSERDQQPILPIYSDLIMEIYSSVVKHLEKIWWNPDAALTTGRVFGKI